MKKGLIIISFLLSFLVTNAQESTSSFNFLKIPLSSHLAALGGDNVSLTLDDPSFVFNNPAMAANVNDKSLNLDYVTYLRDTKIYGGVFTDVFSVRHTLGITAQVMDYGTMDETDEDGNLIGTFSAKDMAFSALYSYTMGNGWVGGATGRFIYSKYAEYSATAIGVDIGLNYHNEDKNFSFGIVAKNIGTQLSSFYEDEKQHLPFDLQIGITKRMSHAPFRYSITLKDLTRWSNDYYFNPEGKNSIGRKIFNHVVFGLNFIPTEKIYLSAGYNFRRGNELKAAGSAHGAGWSFGGGLQLNTLKLGIAYATYHVDASSLLFNISYSFNTKE
ncbi:MAG: type IX secretion system protein PorQ [Prevotellaceae bacterium]|nr:type IX secretion system protein PorQ [Candidatus Faecinaster equi]